MFHCSGGLIYSYTTCWVRYKCMCKLRVLKKVYDKKTEIWDYIYNIISYFSLSLNPVECLFSISVHDLASDRRTWRRCGWWFGMYSQPCVSPHSMSGAKGYTECVYIEFTSDRAGIEDVRDQSKQLLDIVLKQFNKSYLKPQNTELLSCCSDVWKSNIICYRVLSWCQVCLWL